MEIDELGTILYWCEGSERDYDCRVEFVNSDPRMISIFLRFLRAKGVDERRLRIRMAIHVQDDEQVCKGYWRKVTSLDDKNFMATVVKAPSVARKPLPYGTVTIRYNSLELLRQIKNDISRLIERCEKNIATST
jgi:hypothetical protein